MTVIIWNMVPTRNKVSLCQKGGSYYLPSDSAMRAKFGKTLTDFESEASNFGRDLRSGKLSFGFNWTFRLKVICIIRAKGFFPRTSMQILIY
ncbi:MAG: hypothetical protein Ct9H300mP22_2730 [Gammaproteobacteria bacterium]|nr:MAG: hypothetical protein Ct9H300mP22_2730 [Gammaproteobacteria bacterium]